MARKRIRSKSGLFGTVYYYDENGKVIGKSRPGLLEGTRVYTDENGRPAGKSRQGFLAKEVFTDADGDHITTYEGLGGDIHFRDGVAVGHTRPGTFGAAYTTMETEEALPETKYDQEEPETTVLTDAEPCEPDREEAVDELSQHTVIRNVQLFALCLAISLVIAGVLAIIALRR